MAPSPVWQYFDKSASGASVKCNKCQKVYKYNNSTSSLSMHLKVKHKLDLFQENIETTNNEAVAEFAGPLDRTFRSMNAFSADGEKHKRLLDALVFMIVKDNMPFRTPQKEGFKLFCKKLQPLYKVPSVPTVTDCLKEKYEFLKNKIKMEFQNVENICLTTDLWTHKYTMQSYIGLTAHYLKDIDMKSIELGAYPMDERKTTDNIQRTLRDICTDWGLTDEKISAIVSDAGANIKNAIRNEFGEWKHVSCFAHSINNIAQRVIDINISTSAACSVQFLDISTDEDLQDIEGLDDNIERTPLRKLLQKVKSIVRFFKKSEIASKELKALQLQNGNKECLKLIQEVPTRWNSCYEMIERFLLLSDHLGRILLQVHRDRSSKSKPPDMLTYGEVEALSEVKYILKPLWYITQEVSSEKNVTLSKCIPLVVGLRTQLNLCDPQTFVGKEVKEKLSLQIFERFGNIESVRAYAAATLLDPRFKKIGFQNIRKAARVISHLGDLVNAEINTVATENEEVIIEQVEPVDPNDIWHFLDASANNSTQTEDFEIPSQLRLYLKTPTINRKLNPNPFKAWNVMQKEYPFVHKVATRILPIMATSVPSERLFSHAGVIANQLRNRLSPNNLNMLIFLKSLDEDIWFK